jgi:signal transduction histidine kinase
MMANLADAALAGVHRIATGPDYPAMRMPARWRRFNRYAAPVAVVLLVAYSSANVEYLSDARGRALPMASAWLIAIATAVPLAVVFRRPLWGWRLSYLALFAGTFNAGSDEPWPWSPVQVINTLVVLAVVGLRADPATRCWIGLFTLIPVVTFVHRDSVVGVVLLVVTILVLSDLVRRNRLARSALAEQAERNELEQARRAALEERTRIAREMHDIVAHHMSMIAVQGETAPYRLPAMADPVRDEFTAIAASARAALADMRRLLTVLRSDGTSAPTAPQPTLADLAELVAAAARAGMAVSLDLLPPHPDAGGPAGLTAYRIVQEALANAARHAPGAAVQVRVDGGDGAIQVQIRNGPGARGNDATRGAGHGLAGMRERAALLGGALQAGPTEDGGFAVTAVLPDDDRRDML